jgi:hypothetical protein
MRYFDDWKAGCYADEANGHQHLRQVLRGLVEEVLDRQGGPAETRNLLYWLDLEPSDDFSEETEALEFLNENVPEGKMWSIDMGLFLVDLPGEEF